MRMVQVTLNEVVGVVAVRHRRMSARGAVLMAPIVAAAPMVRCARRRIGVAYGDHMVFHLRSVLVVKMAVVEIVLMPLVANAGVPAVGPVNVRMSGMRTLLSGKRLSLHTSSG